MDEEETATGDFTKEIINDILDFNRNCKKKKTVKREEEENYPGDNDDNLSLVE